MKTQENMKQSTAWNSNGARYRCRQNKCHSFDGRDDNHKEDDDDDKRARHDRNVFRDGNIDAWAALQNYAFLCPKGTVKYIFVQLATDRPTDRESRSHVTLGSHAQMSQSSDDEGRAERGGGREAPPSSHHPSSSKRR